MEAAELERRILDQANQIMEPCGLAQGLSVGMVDMGLIRAVQAERCGGLWSVSVKATVTSPDCQHFVYFERELRAAIHSNGEIGEVSIEWADGSDWTPDSMSENLRQQLRERRQKHHSA